MATTPSEGGNATTASMTPAQRLAAKHSAAQSHHATVEDGEDEEFLAHSPSSMETPSATTQNGAAPEQASHRSEKATGKPKAYEAPSTKANGQPSKQNTAVNLNMQSEEAFPSLSAPKSQVGAMSSRGKEPAAGTYVNGGHPWSNTSSKSSTPVSGAPPAAMSFPGNRGQGISIPGRKSQTITVLANHLKSRAEMKKPIQEILRDLQRRSKATVDMKSSAGSVTFYAQGPTMDSVTQLLKDVVANVGARQLVKEPVPISMRAQIIGKQGAKIQEIEKRTGAKIRLAKQVAVPSDYEDDDTTVDVEIEGDALTAAQAQQEIKAIVGQRAFTINKRMHHVPPEYYPFLTGAHNTRVNAFEDGREVKVKIPQYHTWHTQPPPPKIHPNQPAPFTPQDGYHILISGDREAARQVQEEIEREVARLRSDLNHDQISIPKERHSFILGGRGNSLHDFLEETGCSIIMPPPSSDTEMLTIVGPREQIDYASNKVMDLAMSVQMHSLDIGRQHPQAPAGAQAHSRDLMRYLQQRQALRELEQLHNANVMVPQDPEGSSAWQVFARDGRNAIKARTELMNLVSAHPPARFRNLDLHPYHQHRLQKQHAQAVRDNYGVHLVFAEPELSNGPLLLVYEGPSSAQDYRFPKTRPSHDEASQFQQALAEAEQYILNQAGNQNITEQSFEIPLKYHDKTHKFLIRQEQDAANVVQILGFDPNQTKYPPKNGANFPVNFRGPANAVDQSGVLLQAFIDEQIREDAERGYTTACDFPQRFANQLIGQKGSNINKLREEFDVEINVRGDQVEIQGPKAKADAAKSHIISFAKKQEDEVTHTIKVKNQFHRDLVGKDGNQVKKLQERYRVRITFPRANKSPSPDDQSLADGETEAVPKARRSTQAPDEVSIRGPRRGADGAREELLSLYQYVQDNSHTSTVPVARALLPSLIGQGGRDITSLRMNTGAQIDVPRDLEDSSGRVNIKIKGTKSQVENARTHIQQKSKVFDDSVSRTLNVERKYHQSLLGRGGETLRQLVIEAGGPEDQRERNRLVRVPPISAPEDVIRLEGPPDVVEKLAESIQSFVDQREKRVSEIISVAPERHGLLIGRGGQTRRALESEFSVSLGIPNTSVTGPERSAIKIAGESENVARAKDRILGMVRGQEGEVVPVSHRLYHAVVEARHPNIFLALSRDFKVSVDHAGQQKPPRYEIQAPTRSAAMTGLPLITDATIDTSMADVEDNHTWDVVSSIPEADDASVEETIPWVLKGQDSESIAKAKEQLLKAVAAAEQTHVGFLGLPDSSLYRYVIGDRGSIINGIRRETGCRIDIPQLGSSEAIRIQGDQESLEYAKQLMLDAVINGSSGRR